MRSKEDIILYYWEFWRLSKPLLDSQHLTPGKCNKLLWHGFHKEDRAEMYTRLIVKNPQQPSKIYFDYLDIYEVARAILEGEDSDAWSGNSSDDLQSPRNRRLEHTWERHYDAGERDL